MIRLWRRSREHPWPTPGPPPEPEPGELIDDPLWRAHFLEFLFRWAGVWLIAMSLYLVRVVWLFCSAQIGLVGKVVAAGFGMFVVGYIWAFALVARRWIRITTAYDLQRSDRRSLKARTEELDVRDARLETLAAELQEWEDLLNGVEAQRLADAKAEAARDAVELAARLERPLE